MRSTSLFLRRTTKDNIFLSFLDMLTVKHTKEFSARYFREYPYKDSLYGLKSMLSDYDIAVKGARVETMEELSLFPTPYIAQTGNSFVIVTDIKKDCINYEWDGMTIENTYEEFQKTWTGVVLLAEADENSAEPNYQKNHKKEMFETSVRTCFMGICILLLILLLYRRRIWEHADVSLLLFLSIAGAYVSYLLLKKQFKIYSRYADKICSMFKKGDCNSVLESSAAKLFGIVSWSEIGFGYFISNILLILLTPHLMSWQALISICVLPYPLWSVWYQKTKARQWCPLCLIVQVILILTFITNLLFGHIVWPIFSVENLLVLSILYLLPVTILMLIFPILRDKDKNDNIVYEMNSLRMHDSVFKAILKSQDFHKISKSDSHVIWGNINASIRLSVITNPYCQPCASMHKRLEQLRKNVGDKFSIQYIFIAFNDKLKEANRLLTAIYLKNDVNSFLRIMDEWYESGKFHWDDFERKYTYNTNDDNILQEITCQSKWLELNKIHATPTILVNGYQLPLNYKVEDLAHFMDISIE